jgi:acid phosphatase type 7
VVYWATWVLLGVIPFRNPIGAEVAQSVEQRTENPCVAGSIPALGILFSDLIQLASKSPPRIFVLLLCLCFSAMVQAQQASVESGETFVVKPYLQLGDHPSLEKSERMDICWSARADEGKWRVEVRGDEKESWKKQPDPASRPLESDPRGNLLGLESTISGLTPGAQFEYRILKNEKEVFRATGRARKSAHESYHFVVFGDMGAGSPGQKAVAYQIYKNEPDFIVLAGDIVYMMGLFSEYLEKFFPIYNTEPAAASPATGAPILRSTLSIAVIGNHDVALGDNANGVNLDKFRDNAMAFYKLWSEPLNGPLSDWHKGNVPKILGSVDNVQKYLKAAGKRYPQMSNYSFDYANSHWLVLDANPYMNWTDQSLRKWVTDDLAKANKATWKFVCFHQPGFSFDSAHYNEQRMRLLCDLFEQGGVDIVFSGHAHDYQRTFPLTFKAKRENDRLTVNPNGTVDGEFSFDKAFDGQTNNHPHGIIYLVSGAGGAKLYGSVKEKNPFIQQTFTLKFNGEDYSFTSCNISGSSLSVRQISGDGKVIDSFTVEKAPERQTTSKHTAKVGN